MTLEKCLELIKILESEIADENTPAEQKEFNKEWIFAIKKSISVSFEKSINKAEKKAQKIAEIEAKRQLKKRKIIKIQ